MIQESEKYTHCDICGATILEKCAIEENGKILCGDCVVKGTNNDVAKAEELAQEKRDKEYERERRAIVLKQKKRGIVILMIALIVFGGVQVLMQVNKPEPVQSIPVDFSRKLPVAKSLITIGIYKYSAEKEKLPSNLNELYPKYLPTGVNSVFDDFSYIKLDDHSYELEIVDEKKRNNTESDHNAE